MTCTIGAVSGHTLRDRMSSRARSERVPLQADIEIIATCNYKCVHCYIAPCAHRDDVMSLESAKVILQKLADAGVGFVNLHQIIDVPKALGDRVRGWSGAAWEQGYSQRAHWIDEFQTFPQHPTTRGVKDRKSTRLNSSHG